MKKQPLFLIITVVCILLKVTCFGQVLAVSTKSKADNNRFYATLEDYKNNKAMAGYEIEDNSWQNVFGQSISVKTGNETKRLRIKDFPAELFVYNNSLVRACEGEMCNVLVYGGFCVYDRVAPNSSGNNLFYSDGITGKLGVLSKGFKKYLVQFGLQESYDAEHKAAMEKKPGEKPGHRSGNPWAVRMKYYDLINEKLK